MAGVRNLLVLCLFAVLLFSDVVDCKISEDCVIKYDSVVNGHIHSLIVGPADQEFLYPSMEANGRILRIPAGKEIVAACPGKGNGLLLNGQTSSTVTCQKGKLYFGNSVIKWSDLGCESKPRPSVERVLASCGKASSSSSSLPLRGTSYSVEWPIAGDLAVPQISICFNEDTETALYTHHKIHGRYIAAKTVDPDRPGFKKEKMFSVRIENVYGKDIQKSLFLELLEDRSHLTAKNEHYLARGHLAPDSDFVLEPEQDATYFYANVVPQWQAINNGNWKSLENSVRELAENRGRTLEVWTGIYDILHLPSASGESVELFLGLSEKQRLVPVPALMWKVVHDPASKTAIAIVAVNDVKGLGTGSNPSIDLHEPPCTDLCSEVAWVDWDTSDLSSGLTFCCSVPEIRKKIPVVPNLGSVGILYS